MNLVWSLLGLIALGTLLVFLLDAVDRGVEKLVRRVRPRRTHQHYPGGPYLQTQTVSPYSF